MLTTIGTHRSQNLIIYVAFGAESDLLVEQVHFLCPEPKLEENIMIICKKNQKKILFAIQIPFGGPPPGRWRTCATVKVTASGGQSVLLGQQPLVRCEVFLRSRCLRGSARWPMFS